MSAEPCKGLPFLTAVVRRNAAVLLVLADLLFLACCPVFTVLCISGQGAGQKGKNAVLLSRRAAREGFVISYTHSVNKGRVRDFYACRGKLLVLERTVFVSYGAGIPEPDESPGAVFALTDSGYEISGLERSLGELLMAVGLYARHSIAIRKEGGLESELFLEDYFERQTPVLFKLRRISPLRLVLSGDILRG